MREILYEHLIKTENGSDLIVHVIYILFGFFWMIFITLNVEYILDKLVYEYMYFNIHPIYSILVLEILPLVTIYIGLLGINDYCKRKNI
jgi:hypothetical protein